MIAEGLASLVRIAENAVAREHQPGQERSQQRVLAELNKFRRAARIAAAHGLCQRCPRARCVPLDLRQSLGKRSDILLLLFALRRNTLQLLAVAADGELGPRAIVDGKGYGDA